MPVTNYHTIGGQILGEQTGGVVTEYLHDALGSVTGTTDGSGNLQNSYRWAGYGTQISKTGTATDPKFLWNGIWGYRQTGRPHAGVYVRRRHYDWRQAAWTSIDGHWPLEPAFRYGGSQPQTRVDTTGQLSCRTDQGPSYISNCGNARWITAWMPGQKEKAGWVMQHVVMEFDVHCCVGDVGSSMQFEYWEAWCVDSKGEVYDCCNPMGGSVTDDFRTGAMGISLCSYGKKSVTGTFWFIGWNGVGSDCPSDLSCGSVKLAGGLCSTEDPQPPGPGGGSKSLAVSYACCCGPTQGGPGCPTGNCDPNYGLTARGCTQ